MRILTLSIVLSAVPFITFSQNTGRPVKEEVTFIKDQQAPA
jgi:hypothetical protein